MKAKKFEPEIQYSVGERLRKRFPARRLSKKGNSTAESFLLFLAVAVINTGLLGIGIVAPACWVIKILFGLGLASFNPEIYHMLLYTVYCFPIGLGLALFKFPERHGWFIILMAGLFCSGLVAPVILGALCKLIIQLALLWVLEIRIVSVISGIVYLLLTAAGLINGFYITLKASDLNTSGSAHSAAGNSGRESYVHDDIFDTPESDSDSGDSGDGGDGGGDGGD